MKKITKYFQSIWQELKKVSWPSRSTIVSHTAIVLVSSLVAMAAVSAIDYGLSKAVEYFVSLK